MKKFNLSVFGVSIFILLFSSTVTGQRTSLVSVNTEGTGGGNNNSWGSSISADGRYIAFSSSATDLVPEASSGSTASVYVRDTVAGTTTLVSVNNAGENGNNGSYGPVISANGQYVAFTSYATNLTPGDNNDVKDIFITNLVTLTTSLVTVNRDGTGSANDETNTQPQLSADGRFVAFASVASNLVSNDTNNSVPDVFVRDMVLGVTTLVSVNINSGSGNNVSNWLALSADAHYVAFGSWASDLVPRDRNHTADVFVRDLILGTTELVSVNMFRKNSGNGYSNFPTISADGRLIAFESVAKNLTPNDSNVLGDVYVRDIVAKKTTLVSVNKAGNAHNGGHPIGPTVISANGRVVLFMCADSDMVENDDNGRIDFFARDLKTGITHFVSAKVPRYLSHLEELNHLIYPDISADGRFVVFFITRYETGWGKNVYVRDLMSTDVTLVNMNNTNTGSSNWGIQYPVISEDGRYIAFESIATDLVPVMNIPNRFNVFAFRNTQLAVDDNRDWMSR